MNTTASAATPTLVAESVNEVGVKTETIGAAKAAPDAETRIKVIAITVLFLSFAADITNRLMGGMAVNGFQPIFISILVFDLVCLFLVLLIVMLLFQIGKRFRNPRSRWRIFLNTGLVLLGLQFFSIICNVLDFIKMFTP
jgi:hypothetical protein